MFFRPAAEAAASPPRCAAAGSISITVMPAYRRNRSLNTVWESPNPAANLRKAQRAVPASRIFLKLRASAQTGRRNPRPGQGGLRAGAGGACSRRSRSIKSCVRLQHNQLQAAWPGAVGCGNSVSGRTHPARGRRRAGLGDHAGEQMPLRRKEAVYASPRTRAGQG